MLMSTHITKRVVYTALLLLAVGAAEAQDFITRGKIEYEIKRNNRRRHENVDPRYNSFYQALPEFDVTYRELTFAWDQWIYSPGRIATTASSFVTESSIYVNLGERSMVVKEKFLDDYFVLSDSLRPIRWRLEQETRKIAGWECRKAIGRIHDSVYVVAFYCPEIITQGGPEFFTGLPGMILGLAIPRQHTTWFATKVEIASIDEATITPPKMKKGKQYDKNELADVLVKKYHQSGWWKDANREKVVASISDYILY